MIIIIFIHPKHTMEEGPSISRAVHVQPGMLIVVSYNIPSIVHDAVNPLGNDANARAKAHPLFPVLDYTASQVQEIGKQQKLHSKRLARIKQLLEDQGKLIEKFQKNAFSLKDEHLEVFSCMLHVHTHNNYMLFF